MNKKYWILIAAVIIILLVLIMNYIPICSDYPINIIEYICDEEKAKIVFKFSCSDTEKYKPIKVFRESVAHGGLPDEKYSKDFTSFEPFQNITFIDDCIKPSQYSISWSCAYRITTRQFSLKQNTPIFVVCKKYDYIPYADFYVKMRTWKLGISDDAMQTKQIRDNSGEYISKNVTVSGIIISTGESSPAWNAKIWHIDDGTGYLGVITPLDFSTWETGDEITITGILSDTVY